MCLTSLEQKLQRFESLFLTVELRIHVLDHIRYKIYKIDYIYFGTRSIIVCSEHVTIQDTKYIAEDSFFADIVGLKALSHLIPHFQKLILFEYSR